MLHAEVFGPITVVKLKLKTGPAHDPQKVCFVGSHRCKKLGLKGKPTTALRHCLFGSTCCVVYLIARL